MVTLILIIVILAIALIIVRFGSALAKDKMELANQKLEDKFSILINQINNGLHNGKGKVVAFKDDPRMLNLFNDDKPNMIINFFYSTGNLCITLKYKYYQKELIREVDFRDVRNIDTFKQKDIGNQFIEIANKEIERHKQNVTNQMKTNNYSSSADYGTNDIENDNFGLSPNFSELTKDEKKSILNFCYTVYTADGSSESEFTDTQMLGQLLGMLQLNWLDCKNRYMQYGNSQMIADLKKIKKDSMPFLVLDVFFFTIKNNKPNEACLEKYQEIFEEIGISENELGKTLQKAMLVGQMFGA